MTKKYVAIGEYTGKEYTFGDDPIEVRRKLQMGYRSLKGPKSNLHFYQEPLRIVEVDND